MQSLNQRVLVTVKAYPQPSQKHGETVCVAGVALREDPAWVRMFPVPFRSLDHELQFDKYQVVRFDARRPAHDPRPESWQPNLSSLVLEGTPIGTGPKRDWLERWSLLHGLAGETTTCELKHAADADGLRAPSLGLIKPIVDDVVIERNAEFAADKKALAEAFAQEDLFGNSRPELEPVPFRLWYRYRCAAPQCPSHRQSLLDWELGEAARHWRRTGTTDADMPAKLRQKFLEQMCGPDRDTYFFVGNQFRAPSSFMVLGVFWPPRATTTTPTLFD